MIITISGQAGSGKTSTGRALAKKLKYQFYDIGTLRKMAAKKRGMTIEEYNKYGMTHPETDIEADAEAIKLGKTEDNFVIQGRVAYCFIPNSLKVYLTVSPDVAAKRILLDKDNPERNSQSKVSSISEIKKLCVERDKSDVLRYKKIYGIKNFNDKKNYDLVIDTSKLTIEQVV
jgi:CMP/dCMP kinase